MCFCDDDDDDGGGGGDESIGRIVTVRPGRRLFVRRIILGPKRHDRGSTSNAATDPPTLVFVHGSCATERQYHRLVKAMQDEIGTPFPPGTTCILFDLAGCGQSPPPTRSAETGGSFPTDGSVKSLARTFWSGIAAQDSDMYSNDESIQDLRAIVDTCAPLSPLFLMGHSYAANLILPYVLAQSVSSKKDVAQAREMKGVILLSCGIRTQSNPLPDGGSPWIRNLPLPVLNCMQSSLTSGFVTAAMHPDSVRQNPDIVDELVEYCNNNRMEVVKAYHSQTNWFSLTPPSSRLPPLPTPSAPGSHPLLPFPILIVHGDQDRIIPIEAGQEMANQLAHRMHDVPNAGHMIMMERPQEVASHIRNFVSLFTRTE
jgi:pimeloyl-ACP methyl ester carboxylesterase